MTIFKIAAGVFLENLAFALLAFLILSAVWQSERSAAVVRNVNDSYDEMLARHPEMRNQAVSNNF